MTREELIAELERIAHTWENHPIHSDMANTLREAAAMLDDLLTDDGPYEAIGTREEVEKAIMGIEPDDTPFMRMITLNHGDR